MIDGRSNRVTVISFKWMDILFLSAKIESFFPAYMQAKIVSSKLDDNIFLTDVNR